MLRHIVALFTLSVILCSPSAKALAATGPSNTPIAVTPPKLPGGSIANAAPPGPFFQGFQPPYPTNSWWAGFAVPPQNAVAAGPFPFQTSTTNTGLQFGLSNSASRTFDGTSVHQPTQLDWSVSFNGLPNALNNRRALAWDTQTVSLQYFSADGSTTLNTYLVPGSPYMTFIFKNAAVVITSLQGAITSFQWVTAGTKAKVTTSGGTYIIYSVSGPITLTQNQNTLVSPAGFTGTLRFAKLEDASQEAILDTAAGTYATGLVMSYSVSNDVSTQTWTWNVVGNPANLLILSWPHHRKVLQAPNYVNIQYLTIKGYMKGVMGNQWILNHALPTVSWFPPNAPQASCLPELNRTLDYEVNALTVMVPGDFYFWGGSIGRAAQLATIAEHIGRMDLVQKVVNILEESFAYWFDPTHSPAATYETGWGGFIDGSGAADSNVDFGNGYYNDHHFHYGYLLHGAAVIGKYDTAWLNQHLDFLTHAARDIGNPSPQDPHYPVTRHMDWFAGHSWASGIANGAGPRDEESTGEAINGYYGLLLFANAINNPQLIGYARMLLAVEIAGAQTYWHLYSTNTNADTPYPEQGFRNLVTVGNVMDTQAGAWLFWGAQTTEIAAIQILPVTPVGHYTYDTPWMQEVISYCQSELVNPTIGDAFKSVIYAAYANVNPQAAYNYSEGLSDWGTGNSASNQLYYVSTQASTTNICYPGQQTPQGVFYIQDVATGLYVGAAGGGGLSASTPVNVLATKFQLAFVPGGGTIQSLSNYEYVTADPAGSNPLSASRPTASSYEKFRWYIQPDGTYKLTALVNRGGVSSSSSNNGALVNNPAVAASFYRLIPTGATTSTTSVPASGYLRSQGNNNYIVSTSADPTLRATAGTQAAATKFNFALVKGTAANPPYYSIQNQVTGMFVTGAVDGSTPLAAARNTPSGWEYFQIVAYQGSYIVVHAASGNPTSLQPGNTLQDKSNTLGNGALWLIQ